VSEAKANWEASKARWAKGFQRMNALVDRILKIKHDKPLEQKVNTPLESERSLPRNLKFEPTFGARPQDGFLYPSGKAPGSPPVPSTPWGATHLPAPQRAAAVASGWAGEMGALKPHLRYPAGGTPLEPALPVQEWPEGFEMSPIKKMSASQAMDVLGREAFRRSENRQIQMPQFAVKPQTEMLDTTPSAPWSKDQWSEWYKSGREMGWTEEQLKREHSKIIRQEKKAVSVPAYEPPPKAFDVNDPRRYANEASPFYEEPGQGTTDKILSTLWTKPRNR
jgi:hypothetical protein